MVPVEYKFNGTMGHLGTPLKDVPLLCISIYYNVNWFIN